MAEDPVYKVFLRAEHRLAVDVEVHLVHVQKRRADGDLQDLSQSGIRHSRTHIRQVHVGVDAAELLEKVEDGELEVLEGVIALGNGLFDG